MVVWETVALYYIHDSRSAGWTLDLLALEAGVLSPFLSAGEAVDMVAGVEETDGEIELEDGLIAD